MQQSTAVTTAITAMDGRAARISQFGDGLSKVFGWNLDVAGRLNTLVTRINATFETRIGYDLVNKVEPLLKDFADKETDLNNVLSKIDSAYDARMVLFNQALVDLPTATTSLKGAINAIDKLDTKDDDQLIISSVQIDATTADFI